MRAAPRVFLRPAEGRGIGIGIGGSSGNTSCTSTCGSRSNPAPVAAPFGSSIFDAVSTGKQQSKSQPKQKSQQEEEEHSQTQTPSSLGRHYDRMVVRMEEVVDDTGTASVVVGPATSTRSNGSDDSTCTTTASNSSSTGGSPTTRKCWSVPFARAANQPSLLSTACPTVSLANHGWYDTNEKHREHVRLGVAAAVCDPDGRILLTRRAARMRSFPHAWVVPGGGLDDGEGLVDCVVREVREETGVIIDSCSVEPICLWESCYPTSGDDCISAGTGITAHYLVVYCLAKTEEKDMSKLQNQVVLDEQETDLALWLSPSEFARTLDHPLGGTDIGSLVVSGASASDASGEVALKDLCGIYPRGAEMKGIAQGSIFMLEELLQSTSKGGSTACSTFQ